MSFEEILDDDAARIAEHGFVLVGVQDPPGRDAHPAWCYTVGLLDAGHPELIVTGVSVDVSSKLLSALAGAVLGGERFEVGNSIDLGPTYGDARVGVVNDAQFELGTFNMWKELHVHGAVQATEFRALQIVVPSATFFCSDHRDAQPLLDDPAARLLASHGRPNRALRRAHRPRRRAS
jgi:hypothetical protein